MISKYVEQFNLRVTVSLRLQLHECCGIEWIWMDRQREGIWLIVRSGFGCLRGTAICCRIGDIIKNCPRKTGDVTTMRKLDCKNDRIRSEGGRNSVMDPLGIGWRYYGISIARDRDVHSLEDNTID